MRGCVWPPWWVLSHLAGSLEEPRGMYLRTVCLKDGRGKYFSTSSVPYWSRSPKDVKFLLGLQRGLIRALPPLCQRSPKAECKRGALR